jgi:hypothetical protein
VGAAKASSSGASKLGHWRFQTRPLKVETGQHHKARENILTIGTKEEQYPEPGQPIRIANQRPNRIDLKRRPTRQSRLAAVMRATL